MKSRINLYSTDFLPVELFVSIKNIAKVGVAVIVIGAVFTMYCVIKNNKLNGEINGLLSTKSGLEGEKVELNDRLSKRKPDPRLISQVNLAKERLHLKQILLKELVHKSTVNSSGFSKLFTELAKVSVTGFWLEHIYVYDNSLSFSGYSLKPQTVPYWINKLSENEVFSGYAFSSMIMAKDEGAPISFSLFSRPKSSSAEDYANDGKVQ